jgi:FkbM family methyltransferase
MGIISYAQNFEDVMLWRCLGHVKNGFYIDVGAHHPVDDSVSLAFYENGWRGLHVEPSEFYSQLLKKYRPDEITLTKLLSDKNGASHFFEIAESGLSTGIENIAIEHQKKGYITVTKEVETITLDSIFADFGDIQVHWLKIDVEGMEKLVLSGWRESAYRPWVILIESTYPNSQVETHEDWEKLVIEKSYKFVYFDGLNRYYISKQHPELEKSFSTPPNIFDDFTIAPSSPYACKLRSASLESNNK